MIVLEENRSVLTMPLRGPIISCPQVTDITFGSWHTYREETTR
ncbi:hypothetical protein ACWEP5_03400 [Nocardia niigatensis]